jgi:hypothetical protein
MHVLLAVRPAYPRNGVLIQMLLMSNGNVPLVRNAVGLAIRHRSFRRPKPTPQIVSENHQWETALFQRYHSASFASPTVEETEFE